MNRFTAMILTCTLALSAQSVFATDLMDDSARHVVVHFADLDISRVEGAATLYKRLQTAANTVCADWSNDLSNLAGAKACITKAISTAVAEINRPVLSAYYRSKLGMGNAALREASN
jgi:UrcA family protein